MDIVKHTTSLCRKQASYVRRGGMNEGWDRRENEINTPSLSFVMKCLSCSFIWWSAQSSKTSNSAKRGLGCKQFLILWWDSELQTQVAFWCPTEKFKISTVRKKKRVKCRFVIVELVREAADSRQSATTTLKPPAYWKTKPAVVEYKVSPLSCQSHLSCPLSATDKGHEMMNHQRMQLHCGCCRVCHLFQPVSTSTSETSVWVSVWVFVWLTTALLLFSFSCSKGFCVPTPAELNCRMRAADLDLEKYLLQLPVRGT